MTRGSYIRFPHVHEDLLTFVAEDDVWIAPLGGGRAWRLSVDRVKVSHPRFSPDGAHVAWTSWRDSDAEVHVAPVSGGPARRLTYWAHHSTRSRGWIDPHTVLATSAHGQPFDFHTWAYTVPLDGGPGVRQPYGPVSDLHCAGGHTLLLTGAASHDPAHWKRYRGGGTGRLWLDGRRLLADLPGQLASPMIVGDRVVFLSDHEGTGNLYSCAFDGSGLTRHTDHDGFYARHAATDGRRIVYVRAGELWLLPDLDAEPERLEIVLGGAGIGRRPYRAPRHVTGLSCDRTGRASAVEMAGAVFWVTHEDGPVRALAARSGVRARLPVVLGPPTARPRESGPAPQDGADGETGSSAAGTAGSSAGTTGSSSGTGTAGSSAGTAEEGARPENGPVAWVSDADGEDRIELAEPGGTVRAIASGRLGRVVRMTAAPDGGRLAVAAHDGRLLLVATDTGEVTELARSDNGPVGGCAFSPDSAWLAWAHPLEHGRRGIRMARLAPAGAEPGAVEVVEVTDGRFADSDPVFTADGRYLAFLSRRGFDPIYDVHSFDLAFPLGSRPYLVPLAAATASPFAPLVEGRPVDGGSEEAGEVRVDPQGMAARVTALPVPLAHYTGLKAVKDGLAWLRHPIRGELGDHPSDRSPRPVLEYFDLTKRKCDQLAEGVDAFAVSGDGRRLVLVDGHSLRAMNLSKDGEVDIDLERIRVEVDPPTRWRHAYAEAGRIVRDHFWVADMAGVDWPAVLDAYRPWLDRIGGADDFADLLREVFGELGSSHAYVARPIGGSGRYVGLLGADLGRDTDGLWRVRRILAAESSDPLARSPLAGTGVRPGDAILAVDGIPVDPRTGPAPLLVDTAERPVELTVESGDRIFRVAVVPLLDDRRLRYHAWVADRRQRVHRLSDGRTGYLHVPDMGVTGWAQLHRDLTRELARESLIVDVRGNRGGHVSELVVEKLARRIVGWAVGRHHRPMSYPMDAPRGPVVVVCDEETCSDGDIITAAVQSLGLGPVVGTRTWGGVIGYSGWHRLSDGTYITVPGWAHWFESHGWDLENRGAVPDVEVLITPADWAVGADPQLDTAVRLALEELARRPAATPPDPATRPARRRPPLPPRQARDAAR